jgi:aquaporin NIP
VFPEEAVADMRRYPAEFLGTFILVFCGTGAIIVSRETGQPSHAGIAATFGLTVMVLVYSLSRFSGAHLNPAVSIALAISGRFPANKLLPYIGSQIAGALTASVVMRLLFPASDDLGATIPAGGSLQSFVLEFFLAFILMLVILSTADESKYSSIIAPLAIGATVGLEAMFAGPISGASMNPARSIGPALISGNISTLWVYIAAPILGAAAATFLITKKNNSTT